jgi:hypothetical protein
MILILEGSSFERCEQIASNFLRLMIHVQNDFLCALPNDYYRSLLPKNLTNSPRCQMLSRLVDFYEYEHRFRELLTKLTPTSSLLAVNYYRLGTTYRYRPSSDHIVYLSRGGEDLRKFRAFVTRHQLSHTILEDENDEVIFQMLATVMKFFPHPSSVAQVFDDSPVIVLGEEEEEPLSSSNV